MIGLARPRRSTTVQRVVPLAGQVVPLAGHSLPLVADTAAAVDSLTRLVHVLDTFESSEEAAVDAVHRDLLWLAAHLRTQGGRT